MQHGSSEEFLLIRAFVAHDHRLLDVNYLGLRIDSAFLLPNAHCCLIKIVTLVE